MRSCQGFGQSSFQLSRWAFPFLPVCNFDKRMYARILTCVGIMTHVRRTFLPIPSMGDPEHTHPDSESRCSIISIVTFSGGSSSTCRDRSCRIWGSAAVPLIAGLPLIKYRAQLTRQFLFHLFRECPQAFFWQDAPVPSAIPASGFVPYTPRSFEAVHPIPHGRALPSPCCSSVYWSCFCKFGG